MIKIKKIEALVQDYGYAQLYWLEDVGEFELRLPGYDQTPDLMKGQGKTFAGAMEDLLSNIRAVEDEEATSEDVEATMEAEAEVESDVEAEVLEDYFYAAPSGGKNHLFKPDWQVSLCGKSSLPEEFEGKITPAVERQPDPELDCKLCIEALTEDELKS